MRGVRANGSSRRLPRGSVLSNVCGSGDHGQELRFVMPSGNCVRSWIAGRQPTARRTFIGGYESCWSCSGRAPPVCKPLVQAGGCNPNPNFACAGLRIVHFTNDQHVPRSALLFVPSGFHTVVASQQLFPQTRSCDLSTYSVDEGPKKLPGGSAFGLFC